MESDSELVSSGAAPHKESRLSYKFQRLRERLRVAIDTGELSGKLPGERQLARKFRVNAKTLSKALTDLAAEGLLERSIGRGTYVRGTDAVSAIPVADRWLVVSDSNANDHVIDELRKLNGELQVSPDIGMLRPSMLNSIRAVINFQSSTPRVIVHDLIVRGIAVVAVGHEPTVFSTNTLLFDELLGAAKLARSMALLGHRSFAVVQAEGPEPASIASAVTDAVRRVAEDARVNTISPDEVVSRHDGATALICESAEVAGIAIEQLKSEGMNIPQRASIAAVGSIETAPPCTGYYSSPRERAYAILDLVRSAMLQKRPTTIWLAGTFHDAGTIAAAPK